MAAPSEATTRGLKTTLKRLRGELDPDQSLTELARGCPDGLLRLAPDGRLADVNPAFERMLGWRPEVMRGRTVASLAHPEDRALLEARIARLAEAADGEQEETIMVTFRARRVDARYRWLEATLRVERPGDADSPLVGAVRDVHERHEARLLDRRRTGEHASLMRIARAVAIGGQRRQLLRTAAEELRDSLDAGAVLIHRADLDAGIARCEAAARRLDRPGGSDPLPDLAIEGESGLARAILTGAPAHLDHGASLAMRAWRHEVAAPIATAGPPWGAVTALFGRGDRAPDEGTGRILESAGELLALAVAPLR